MGTWRTESQGTGLEWRRDADPQESKAKDFLTREDLHHLLVYCAFAAVADTCNSDALACELREDVPLLQQKAVGPLESVLSISCLKQNETR